MFEQSAQESKCLTRTWKPANRVRISKARRSEDRTTPSREAPRHGASSFRETGSHRVLFNRSLGRLYVARLAHSKEHRFDQIDLCQLRRGRCSSLRPRCIHIFKNDSAIIAVTEELKRTAFVAKCGTCALGSRRRRASRASLQ